MALSFLSKIFPKKSQRLTLPDLIPLKTLKSYANEHGYELFENIPIYYRGKSIVAALLLFIPRTGLVLFEYKEWSFEELKNATVQKASHEKELKILSLLKALVISSAKNFSI